jgi:hypothetical protein
MRLGTTIAIAILMLVIVGAAALQLLNATGR